MKRGLMKKFTFEEYVDYLSKRFEIPIENIGPGSEFTGDLGLDSLSLYSLIEDLERDYDIGVDLSDIVELRTVEKIYNYIDERYFTGSTAFA